MSKLVVRAKSLLGRLRPSTALRNFECPTCHSKGFKPSILPDRCTFCDGTAAGNPPDENDLIEYGRAQAEGGNTANIITAALMVAVGRELATRPMFAGNLAVKSVTAEMRGTSFVVTLTDHSQFRVAVTNANVIEG